MNSTTTLSYIYMQGSGHNVSPAEAGDFHSPIAHCSNLIGLCHGNERYDIGHHNVLTLKIGFLVIHV